MSERQMIRQRVVLDVEAEWRDSNPLYLDLSIIEDLHAAGTDRVKVLRIIDINQIPEDDA